MQDILAVAASLKEVPSDADLAADGGEDSGVILFEAGGLGSADGDDDDSAMFGSFAGGLGSGFGTSLDLAADPDLQPQGGSGSVVEATPAPVAAAPAEEPKRNPLTVLAVVLGLGLVAAGAVYLTSKEPSAPPADASAQAQMSAKPDPAAVAQQDPSGTAAADSAGAGLGAGAAEPEAGAAAEPADTEGDVAVPGEGVDPGLLAAADTANGEDPMAQKAGLLQGSGSSPVAKAGKWEPGDESDTTPTADTPTPTPTPTPKPEPTVAPEPAPQPTPKPASGGASDDEVDCLLNPDLPKCQSGGTSKPKHDEILVPKLPDKLDSTALRTGFNTVKSKAKACGSKHGAAAGTSVKIHASIEGATGKVTAVEAKGEHAGTELGKCVEDAVKDATFEPFKKPSQGVDYSMIM